MTDTEEAQDAADTQGALGAREARASRLPLVSRHVQCWVMTSPRSAPSWAAWLGARTVRGCRGPPSGPWPHCGHWVSRYRSAAASTPPRLVLAGRWIDRLAQQVATLAQGACLTPVGQEAHMPQALEAVGTRCSRKRRINSWASNVMVCTRLPWRRWRYVKRTRAVAHI